ncbi:MAG: hypothetical protein MK289_11255 [Trichodesmium sp. ALOHA_ZT_67]|nr:hypothetical protein [Trichodesmium erythraeum GBRTRLIN201]MCH2049029.1 hypothetical protein [Trichodesmium sp. ALOHA_ZT_67]MCL2929617.1 hypothetical protein [Trichodesmium sp. MAG_R01]MDE5096051.1 hypothetical protein [Trichodesmium sp. St11_bin5]
MLNDQQKLPKCSRNNQENIQNVVCTSPDEDVMEREDKLQTAVIGLL